MQDTHVPRAATQVLYPFFRLYQSTPSYRPKTYILNLTLSCVCNYQYMDYSSAPRITAIVQLTTSYCHHTFDCSHYRYIWISNPTFKQQMAYISSSQVRRWEVKTDHWFLSVHHPVFRSSVGRVKVTDCANSNPNVIPHYTFVVLLIPVTKTWISNLYTAQMKHHLCLDLQILQTFFSPLYSA